MHIFKPFGVLSLAVACVITLSFGVQKSADRQLTQAYLYDTALDLSTRLALVEEGVQATVLSSRTSFRDEIMSLANENSSEARHLIDLKLVSPLISFRPQHLHFSDQKASQHQCLAEAIYYEARSEPIAGQLAVSDVILNRVRDWRYPDTICNVVYQGSERETGCQFSFTCDGSMDKAPKGKYWATSQAVASNVMLGLNKPVVGSATHYHTHAVSPIWAPSLVKTRVVGAHIFYRWPRGHEWRAIREARSETTDT